MALCRDSFELSFALVGKFQMPSRQLYFSYGANMDIEKMNSRCPEARFVGSARLPGYRLAFTLESEYWIWKGGVGDIVKDPKSEVWGLVYELSESDLILLDKYEEAPKVYRRISVGIEALEGRILSNAWAYEVIDKKEFVAPSSAYLDIIRTAAEKHRFPEAYKVFLNTIPTRG